MTFLLYIYRAFHLDFACFASMSVFNLSNVNIYIIQVNLPSRISNMYQTMKLWIFDNVINMKKKILIIKNSKKMKTIKNPSKSACWWQMPQTWNTCNECRQIRRSSRKCVKMSQLYKINEQLIDTYFSCTVPTKTGDERTSTFCRIYETHDT